MEVKSYVSPFLKHGKTKKPTVAVPKGMVRAGTSVDGQLSILSFIDSSLVYILVSVHGDRMEDCTRMNKTTGVQETNGQCPKDLNEFNSTMYGVDCWILICAPKHGKYLIEMYRRQYKWAVRFGDGSADMLWSNVFSYYKSINQGNKAVRQRGLGKFIMKALGNGLPLMLMELKKKRDTTDDDDMIQFYTESNQNHPSST
eukprot:15333452-Ditylum_brightwellii.AAC.1